ncbi:MAG TPA: hypothetical protein ENI02_01105 [Candidatus Aminicenantes bacterium]|nr:hypothetical protein [Candidatus Aminicenantes bacterium]
MSGAAKAYPSVYLLSFLDAAPVLYFKKGRNMERVRELKKADPYLLYSPPFADFVKRSFYLLSALLARSFFERKLCGATGKKQKHTHHFPGDPVFFFKR